MQAFKAHHVSTGAPRQHYVPAALVWVPRAALADQVLTPEAAATAADRFVVADRFSAPVWTQQEEETHAGVQVWTPVWVPLSAQGAVQDAIRDAVRDEARSSVQVAALDDVRVVPLACFPVEAQV